jgi:hypothetical protein
MIPNKPSQKYPSLVKFSKKEQVVSNGFEPFEAIPIIPTRIFYGSLPQKLDEILDFLGKVSAMVF